MIFNQTSKQNKISQGFTLLEVIIVIGIIAIGLVGILIVIQFSISSGQVSANSLIAANLAQEAFEVLRADRDSTTRLDPDALWADWIHNITAGDAKSYSLQINPSDYSWSFILPSDYPLWVDSETGLYIYCPLSNCAAQQTTFVRSIWVKKMFHDDISNDLYDYSYLGVRVSVMWKERGKENAIEIASQLFPWEDEAPKL